MEEMYSAASQAASMLDKTDWRKIIQKYLDRCVASEGTIHYPNAVKQLVSSVAGTFPNWNSRVIINAFVKKKQEEYATAIDDWVERHLEYWIHPGKRLTIEPDIVNAFYKEIFEFIFDLLASRRMLLWGGRKTPGGDQMKEVEY